MAKKKQLTARELVQKCGGVPAVQAFCQFNNPSGVTNWFLQGRDIPRHWRMLLENKVAAK